MTLTVCDLCLHNSKAYTLHIRLRGPYNFKQIVCLSKTHFTGTTDL